MMEWVEEVPTSLQTTHTHTHVEKKLPATQVYFKFIVTIGSKVTFFLFT